MLNIHFKIHTIMYILIYILISPSQIISIYLIPKIFIDIFTDLSVKFFMIMLINDSGSLNDIFTQLFESANNATSINFASFLIKE